MPIPERLLVAGRDDDDRRLDRLLFKAFPDLSRTIIFMLIRKGQVRNNGKRAAIDDRVHEGDRITIKHHFPAPAPDGNEPVDKKAPGGKHEVFPLDILYQDANILALNKPSGILAHGEGSLEKEVLRLWKAKGTVSVSFRPGPIHRLDRNTSGIQLYSLSLEGARIFSRLFHDRGIRKIYCGILSGRLLKSETWKDFLLHDEDAKKSSAAESGKPAETGVLPLALATDFTLALFLPKTGRTHQIRLQASLHGHPLLGDKKYDGPHHRFGYFLHATGLCVPGSEYPLPPLLAPVPDEAAGLIMEIFGKEQLERVYSAVRSILEGKCDDGGGFLFP